MDTFANGIMRRVFGAVHTPGDLARLPAAYRNAGGGLVRRIAAAGILRLALRWPALTVILILTMVAARVVSDRWHDARSSSRTPLRG